MDVLQAFVQQLIHGRAETAKVSAASAILDRAHGRPTIEVGGDATLPFLGIAPPKAHAVELREEARRYSHLCITVLRKIATHGVSETARISAGRALWDRGLGVAAPAKVADEFSFGKLGKKEEAARAAKTAGEGTDWGDDLRPPPSAKAH
jgi:hypothetical protein